MEKKEYQLWVNHIEKFYDGIIDTPEKVLLITKPNISPNSSSKVRDWDGWKGRGGSYIIGPWKRCTLDEATEFDQLRTKEPLNDTINAFSEGSILEENKLDDYIFKVPTK